jgi:hypothetical protein
VAGHHPTGRLPWVGDDTGVEDMKTGIRDVITTINRGMLAQIWEKLEFRLDILRATQGAHIEVR